MFVEHNTCSCKEDGGIGPHCSHSLFEVSLNVKLLAMMEQ